MGRILEKKNEKLVGTVIEQRLETGEDVPFGTTIDLVIAKLAILKIPKVI